MDIVDFSFRSLIGADRQFNAAPEIQTVLDGLARTEDVRFSQDGRRLAIAGFARGTILVLELGAASSLTVTGCLELRHPGMIFPHGVDWIDDDRLVVANRGGAVQIIGVPRPREGIFQQNAEELVVITKVGFRKNVRTPGSVAVVRQSGEMGVWVCNNYARCVSYHRLTDRGGRIAVAANKVALTEGLAIPDGVSISDNGAFMAISNHATHQVLVYAMEGPGQARRVGQLNLVDFPHGLRFLPGGRELIVADAAQPFLQVYRTDVDWRGDHAPVRRVRVMDDETYLRGRCNIQEGGIKGIDIDLRRAVVATTCELQTLRLFDLSDVVGHRDWANAGTGLAATG